MAARAARGGHLWRGYLLVGLLATGGYFALPSAGQNLAYNAVGLSAVVAILIGIRLHRPARRLPWFLLALGEGVATGGDLIWTYNENIRGLVSPFPSASDFLYFAGYGILFAGVLLLVRDQARVGDWAATIDTAIVTVGGGALIWSFLIRPAALDTGQTLAGRIVAGGYPTIDILILALAVRLTLGLSCHTVALRLLIAALGLSFVGDILYGILMAQGRYSTGHPVNLCWLAAYILYGTLALHPSMRDRPGVAAEGRIDLQTGRLPLLALAALAGPALLAIQVWRGLPLDVPLIGGVSALLPLLALARLHLRDAHFRALVRHAAEGTAIVDRQGKTTYQGPAVARILGFSPAALLGTDVFARVHPDDRERARQIFAGLAAARGETCTVTLRVRHADGSWRDVEIHGMNLLAEPSVGGVVVNYRDVTARARAETLLTGQAALLEQIAEDAPLEATLTALARLVETVGDGALVSINLLDEDGITLRCVAAPGLPAAWTAATAAIRVEEGNGACGTAAARKAPVIAADIASDPAWAAYRELALAHGLRACWSLPILTRAGAAGAGAPRLLGTFAIYYATPREPGAAEGEALARSVGLAALAIERARSAAALRQGADSFASLFDATGAALFIHADQRIVAANRAYAAMLGREVDDVLGGSGLDYLTPASRAIAEERIRTGAQGPYEAEVQRRDGTIVPVELAGQAIRYHGRPARLVAQRDIGERQRARAALERSEARFRALVQHATDMVTVIDPQGVIGYQSPAAAHMLGTDPAALVGRSVFALIHREDRARVRLLFARLLAAPHAVLTEHLRVRHRDGSWRTVEVVGTNLLAEPAVGGIVTNLRDITAREAATAALRQSEAILAAAQRIGHIGSWEYDFVRGTLRWSDEVFRIVGSPPQAFVPTLDRYNSFLHPDDRALVEKARRDSAERGLSYAHDCRLIRPDGEIRIVHQRAEVICDAAGRPIRRLGVVQDVTEQRAAEAAVRESAESFESLFEGTAQGIVITEDGLLVAINRAYTALMGYEPDELLGSAALELVIPEDRAKTAVNMGVGYEQPYEVRQRHKNGAIVTTEVIGRAIRYRGRPARLTTVRDVTARKELELRLAHQATHDALTGLPNRALFLDRLAQALGQARRGAAAHTVLFLDLDRFKEVNDSRGHDAGDRFLIAVARRLRRALRDADTLARLGGDEFAILLPGVAEADEAARSAERLLAALARPLPLDDQEYSVTASVGIVLTGPEYARPEEVLRDADVAMYRAKEAGRAGYALFDPAMQAALADRLALERDELTLHFQPIVDLRDRQVAKVEALVRWRHPARGLVPPGAFIALAEETGQIREIGRWVLAAACRQAADWQRAGHPVPVAVNLSAREFQQPALVGEIVAALDAAALDPRWLQLEITESLAMRDAAATAVTLAALRARGVRVAIDDFGTGYSSLAYLKRLPVDTLKIDKDFIDGLGTNPEDTAIVAAIVRLGQTLGLRIVAEGVETAAQATDLRALGCDLAQGYYFSRPLPPDEIAPFLRPAAGHSVVDTGELPLRGDVATTAPRSGYR